MAEGSERGEGREDDDDDDGDEEEGVKADQGLSNLSNRPGDISGVGGGGDRG